MRRSCPRLPDRPCCLAASLPGGGERPGDVGRADGHHDDYPDVIAAPADFGVNVSADDG